MSGDEGNLEEGGQRPEKKWVLSGGITMKVGSYGKKKPQDKTMVIDLLFTYEGDPFPKIVELPYTKACMADSLMHCNTALDDWLKLDDCPTKDRYKNFEIFVNQAIDEYQELQRLGGPERNSKKTKQYTKPTIEEIDGQFFLIADEIYLLIEHPTKLCLDQVNELPFNIAWNGPRLSFKVDPKECYRLLFELISDMNAMQKNKKYLGFCIAVLSYHMMARFYIHIIKIQGNFSLQMSISGPATSTGKSLWMTLCMNIFDGDIQPTTTSLTESSFYKILSEGRNIFVKEFTAKKSSYRSSSIDPKFLEMAVKAIWERGSNEVRHVGEQRINAVIFIDANLVQVMDPAVLDKIGFMYTGEDKIRDEDGTRINRMLSNSRELFQHLPTLLSLGCRTVLEKVSVEEFEGLADVLKVKDDQREAQRVVVFDRMSKALKQAGSDYSLPLPEALRSQYIDRTCITIFNSSDQERENIEKSAKLHLQEISQEELNQLLEYCARSSSFKFKKSGLQLLSSSLRAYLGRLKTISSTIFKGQRGQRVIILPESALSQETVKDLKLVSCIYVEWSKKASELRIQRKRKYAERFVEKVNNYSLTVDIASSAEEAEVFGEEKEKVGGIQEQAGPSSSGRGCRVRPGGEAYSRLAGGTRSRPRPKN